MDGQVHLQSASGLQYSYSLTPCQSGRTESERVRLDHHSGPWATPSAISKQFQPPVGYQGRRRSALFTDRVKHTEFMREKRDLPSCIVRPQSNGSSAVSSVNYNARHIVGTIFDRLNRFCGESPCGEHYGDAKKPTKPVQMLSLSTTTDIRRAKTVRRS